MVSHAQAGPLSRWYYAAKPASWPKLLVPMLLGQAVGVAGAGRFLPGAALVGGLFTVFGLIFIVLLNDWGDRQVDVIKRRMFPQGCSPKTIPDGILAASPVLFGGLTAGALALATALLGAPWLQRPALVPLGVGGMVIFTAYTLPPLKLNYRGGGELLEMLGVGLWLPWLNAYVQSGSLSQPGLWVLPGFALLSLASAIASGLSDEESDRAGGKRTLATRFGNRIARRAVEVLVPMGAVSWWLGALWAGGPAVAVLAVLLLVAFHYRRLLSQSAAAVTNAFRAQGLYKLHLHRAIWHGALMIALCVMWEGQLS